MNEQQLQQILTIQQAIAAAATAAVINSILNPQQAAALASQNAGLESANELQQQLQSNQQESRQSPFNASSSPTAGLANSHQLDQSARIQDLLLQLQQHQQLNSNTTTAAAAAAAAAAVAANAPNNSSINASPLNLNLNLDLSANPILSGANSLNSPIRSPNNRSHNQQDFTINATPGNTSHNSSSHHQTSPTKKLKRHHNHQQHHITSLQAAFQNRNPEATSKHQHAALKNQTSSMPSINTGSRNSSSSTNASSPSSSALVQNHVGLPRKLVRGQDVWLGRGAEQTRQILKCMWCGQSFRTLAEMTQHMKITQHYTNIISQEQITSWRQPENSETGSKSLGASKQSSHQISHDDFSDKVDDSDRDDTFSDDDHIDQLTKVKHPRQLTSHTKHTQHKNDSIDSDSNQEDHSRSKKVHSPDLKPHTRSKKREGSSGRDVSPTSSSSSQRNTSSHNISSLAILNGEPEFKKLKTESEQKDDATDEESDDEMLKKNEPVSKESQKKSQESKENGLEEGKECTDPGDETEDNDEDRTNKAAERNNVSDELSSGGDNPDEDQTSVPADSPTNSSTSASKVKAESEPKSIIDSADPLSALETMVEKSFDPRLRPSVANGGILQRLGIDEEVCPPWQHINYANWYAAAAYGHPMAAALLAAGINLQSGIKLSKNSNPKKNDD